HGSASPNEGGGRDPAHRDPPSVQLQLTGRSAYPAMRLHSICLSLSGISRRLITLTLQRHMPCLVVRGPRQDSATIRQPVVPPISSSPKREPRSRPVRVTPPPNRGADISPRTIRTYLTVPHVMRDVLSLRKATPSHVPLLPHPEKLGLSSRSVLRCPSPKLRPNGDAAGPAKPPQPQVDTPAAYAVTW
ncbi:hypothetical protein CMEL01_08094, partial [Colletotrichum melonis]